MNPRSMAQVGLTLMKQAVLELLAESPGGLRNVDVAEKLDIHSAYGGQQQDYLSWSILGGLLGEGRVRREGERYFNLSEGSTDLG